MRNINKRIVVIIIISTIVVAILGCVVFVLLAIRKSSEVSLDQGANYLNLLKENNYGIDVPELISAQIEKETQINIQKEAIRMAYIEARKKYPGEGGGAEPSDEGITIEQKVPTVIRPGDGSENWQQFVERIIGYQVDTPASWIVFRNDLSPHCGQNCTPIEDLSIQNQVYVGPPGSGPEDGSVLQLRIWEYNIPGLTIKKWIENLDMPEQNKQQEINRIKNVEIGGLNREVSTAFMDVDWQQSVTFVEGNRVYDFTYFSGSNTQFTKDLPTFSKMLSSFTITTPIDLGNKVGILNNGDPKEKMDILFIPQGITDFALFRSRLEDILYRSGTDVNGGPFVSLLNIEPFKSSKNKLNVFYADKNIEEAFFDCWVTEQDIHKPFERGFFFCNNNKIKDTYKAFGFDYITVVFNKPGYTSSGGNVQYLSFDLSNERRFSGFEATFIHEFGHQLGLADEYVITESPSWHCGNATDSPKSGLCFEEYAKIVKLYPNLDTVGCPKWCASYDLSKDDILMRDNEFCSQAQTAEECKKQIPGQMPCTWFNMKHPFFNANCVSTQGAQNVGIDCLADTQCLFGGDYGQLAFNPGSSIMNSLADNKFNGPSREYIKNIFDCCYPYQGSESCKNFINQFKGLDGVGLNAYYVKVYQKIGFCDVN